MHVSTNPFRLRNWLATATTSNFTVKSIQTSILWPTDHRLNQKYEEPSHGPCKF